MRRRARRRAAGVAACALVASAALAPAAESPPIAGPDSVLVGSPAHRGDPHNAIVAVRTQRPLVALSFDDGPSRRWTPDVLAALRVNGAHATFFDVGAAAVREPQLVRAQLRAGNEVADHSWSHPRLRSLSSAALRRQIVLAARSLAAIGGRPPTLFRPPHGDFDRRVSAAVDAAGLRLVGWDLAVERELDGRTPAQAARAIARQARRGSIILAHDGGGRRGRSVAAVALLLPALRRRGLRVVSVSTLLSVLRHGARGRRATGDERRRRAIDSSVGQSAARSSLPRG